MGAIVLVPAQNVLALLIPQEIQRPSRGIAHEIGGEAAVEGADRAFVAEDRAGDADSGAKLRRRERIQLEACFDDIERTGSFDVRMKPISSTVKS